MISAEKRLAGLRYRERLNLDEAACFVEVKLECTHFDAVTLLREAATNGHLRATIEHDHATYTRGDIAAVDKYTTTTSMSDLMSWMQYIGSVEHATPSSRNFEEEPELPIIDTSDEHPEQPSALPVGVSRSVIIGKFTVSRDPVENEQFWKRRLSDPPQWLLRARLSSGGKRVSALWDPVMVAHCLLSSKAKYMGIKAIDKVMRDRFPDRWEQWREETQDIIR